MGGKESKKMTSLQKSANEIQIAGDHYQGEYQHWDLVVDTNMHYLVANASKYVCRWRKKNGLQDLYKARHYAEKMIECVSEHRIQPIRPLSDSQILLLSKFIKIQKLTMEEASVVELCVLWRNLNDLELVYKVIQLMIEEVSSLTSKKLL